MFGLFEFSNFRELIKVCQKNLRKYMNLRDWGWFIAIQKTRPLVGRADPNEELRVLEEKAAATYGVYKAKLDLKEKLLKEMDQMVEEKKALMEQIDKEQGNMSQYTERQEKANAEKGRLEAELARAQDLLLKTENARVQANADKVKPFWKVTYPSKYLLINDSVSWLDVSRNREPSDVF